MRVWIDIDNPPQVQYLDPFGRVFRERGHAVAVTARDEGVTLDLMRSRSGPFVAVGREPGAARWQRALGVAERAARLAALVARGRRPELLLSSSRSSALAAASLGVPAFIVCDYEFSELQSYRRTGANILHSDLIPERAFTEQGFSSDRLLVFPGLKEAFTFAYADIAGTPAYEPPAPRQAIRILVRPPAETSHYFSTESRAVTKDLLEHLAARPDACVVYSPRHAWQTEYLHELRWEIEPVVLDEPVPFLSLLKGMDAVVSAGGTMLREAAYLGIPAFTTFRSQLGAVDRTLIEAGKLVRLADRSDFDRLPRRRRALTLRTPDSLGILRRVAGALERRVAGR